MMLVRELLKQWAISCRLHHGRDSFIAASSCPCRFGKGDLRAVIVKPPSSEARARALFIAVPNESKCVEVDNVRTNVETSCSVVLEKSAHLTLWNAI